jgi:4-amino-4-deoxy-L-arabinose transferase
MNRTGRAGRSPTQTGSSRAAGGRGRFFLLVTLSVVLAFAFQGSRGLYETTEGRYAESAREMLETGNWLVPTLDYGPHWTKPPLTYWAIAGGMILLGENEWGVRAASAVSYIVVVLAVYAMGRLMWGRRSGFAAGLVYATSPLAVLAANSVSTDPLLAMWEALAALAYWRAVAACGTEPRRHASRGIGDRPQTLDVSAGADRQGSQGLRLWIVLFWLFAGLAFLTKGPPALLTPLVVFIYHGWLTATRRRRPALFSRLGLTLFLVTGLGWFVVVGLMYEGLLGRLVRDEIVGRIADPAFNRNPGWYGPFAVILLPFFAGLGPWVVYWRRAWRAFLSWSGWRGRLTGLGRRDAALFCVLWAAVPVGLLCFSRSRLPLYVLPFVPALALLTGHAAVSRVRERGTWSGFLRLGFATGLAMLAVKGIVPQVDTRSDVRPVYEYLRREAAVEPARHGAPPRNVYAYGLEQEYGLMFYLEGRMTRVLEQGDFMRPGELLRLLSDPARRDVDYVVARARADRLSGLLRSAGLSFGAEPAGSYYVFRVDPVSG